MGRVDIRDTPPPELLWLTGRQEEWAREAKGRKLLSMAMRMPREEKPWSLKGPEG